MSNNALKRRTGRITRHRRVRKKIHGTAARPRLAVFRTAKHITAQLIDDVSGKTLAAASTYEKSLKSTNGATKDAAERHGKPPVHPPRRAGADRVAVTPGALPSAGRVRAPPEPAA